MARARRLHKYLMPWLSAVVLLTALSVQPVQRAGRAYAAVPAAMLYGSAPDAPDDDLQAIVENIVSDMPGKWGVAVKKLDTGQYAAYNGDQQQVSASLYKLWAMVELYRQARVGIVSLNDLASVSPDDAYEDSAANELRFDVGYQMTLGQAAQWMITVSDNTAAHLLIRTLGPDNINRTMQSLGLTHSVLDWSGVGDNLTTPLDMLSLLEDIATSQVVDAGASKQMTDLLLGQQINDLLPVGLPDGTPFAHKTGALDALLHDAGIVYSPAGPYIIVVMASEFDRYDTSTDAIVEVSREVYNYFNSRPSSPALYFPETRQSVGHEFLKFWNMNGGLQTFGYPIAPERVVNGVLVQDFERARFELPTSELQPGGTPQVGLGLVGRERAQLLGLSWPPGPDPGTGLYIAQTGQAISGEFLNYWQNNGGSRLFGFPISPAANMVDPSDGKTYMTQWFERARMEINPDLPPGSRIVLAALGRELQQSK